MNKGNNFTLYGNLSRDPVQKKITKENEETTVTFLTVAIGTLSQSKKTDFVDISVFNKKEQVLLEGIKKGQKIKVSGRISTRLSEKPPLTVTSLIASKIELLKKNTTDSEIPGQLDGTLEERGKNEE